MSVPKVRPWPFSPPPTRVALSSTNIVLGVVIALAVAFSVYQWRQPQRLPGVAPEKSAPATPLSRAPQRTDPTPALPAATPEGARVVTKCVVNGTTSYGDAACAQGAKSTQVITKANHNLLAGLTPAQMAAANQIKAAPPAVPYVNDSPRAAVSNADECKSIDAEITQLDAMARQPQSGQMQDWISQQRKERRDRQFRIRCR